MPQQDTSSAREGLVFQVALAHRAVMECPTLRGPSASSETLVLLVLLGLTAQGDAAEASQHQLARLTRLDRRTISTLLPQLAKAGWFDVETRGSKPSILRWSSTGPLASAWVKPALRGVARNAEKVVAAPTAVTRSSSSAGGGSGDLLRRCVPPEVAHLAIRHLYEAHYAAPRHFIKHRLRDVIGLAPEHHERVAAWLHELADELGLTVYATALRAMSIWFRMSGSKGCLAHANHPLAMLVTNDYRDLHRISTIALERARQYHEEDFEAAPPPALDPDENARRFSDVARAAGGCS